MILQYLKMAVRNLRVRPLRSWLTILGIVIGIFLVVALISLSEGLKNSITKELRMMGGDLIIIVPSEDIFTGVV
ncbi:MAG: ABC transporter permease, partial [Minisyncoccales bacterium]